MVFSNVIVEVTISRRSFVFSQSYVQVSAGLTDIGGLAVAAFDLVNCSLSVLWFVFVLNAPITVYSLHSQWQLGLTDSRPITSRLRWPITSTTRVLIPSTDVTQITWLWWWLPLRLSKRQSMSPQTVLFRTTLTRTIVLPLIMWCYFTDIRYITNLR